MAEDIDRAIEQGRNAPRDPRNFKELGSEPDNFKIDSKLDAALAGKTSHTTQAEERQFKNPTEKWEREEREAAKRRREDIDRMRAKTNADEQAAREARERELLRAKERDEEKRREYNITLPKDRLARGEIPDPLVVEREARNRELLRKALESSDQPKFKNPGTGLTEEAARPKPESFGDYTGTESEEKSPPDAIAKMQAEGKKIVRATKQVKTHKDNLI